MDKKVTGTAMVQRSSDWLKYGRLLVIEQVTAVSLAHWRRHWLWLALALAPLALAGWHWHWH
jgi:hypothetical protein